jgi:hypothetical protein
MDCCKQAAKELERLEGHTHIGTARTVQQWHLAFHQNNESFLNPKFHTHGKAMLPPLLMLEQNPALKKLLLQHATSNLKELTAELLLACLHDIALPALLEEFQEESGCPDTPCMSCCNSINSQSFLCQLSADGCVSSDSSTSHRKSAAILMGTRNLR